MMARRSIMQLLAGAAVGLLGGCKGLVSTAFPTRYRVRLTVVVDTPQGVRSGASVFEETTNDIPATLPDAAVRNLEIKGQAVAVDLPDGQVLFLLMPSASWLQAAVDPAWKNDWVESGKRITSGKTPRGPITIALAPSQYTNEAPPMLVRFKDIRDPASVEQVDPANLAATFGAGYALQRITVQVTEDGVTTGIEKRMGWLGKYPEPSLKPDHDGGDFSLPAELHYGDFRQGEFK